MKKILIVEDILNDIQYYRALKDKDVETTFLFVTEDQSFTPERVRDYIDLLHEKTFSWIKEFRVVTSKKLKSLLKEDAFDAYILDSLKGDALSFVQEARIAKEKVGFFSSTTSFRESAEKAGYRACKKDRLDDLIKALSL